MIVYVRAREREHTRRGDVWLVVDSLCALCMWLMICLIIFTVEGWLNNVTRSVILLAFIQLVPIIDRCRVCIVMHNFASPCYKTTFSLL